MSVGAVPRQRYAGYREHHVTTTNQTVRYRHEQNFNMAARRSSEDGGRGVDNRNNQSSAAAASTAVRVDSCDVPSVDTEVTGETARHAASAPTLADRSAVVHDPAMAWFDAIERDLMQGFDNARLNLR